MSPSTEPGLRVKRDLLARLRARLRVDLEALHRSHADALEGITHEDARQESDKDMRSTEASYVARGQARRVVELQEELTALAALEPRVFGVEDPVALGALVTLTSARGEVSYFFAPAAGGMQVEAEGRTVRVVTPRSPLGRALLGRVTGDEVSWATPQGEVEATVTSIA